MADDSSYNDGPPWAFIAWPTLMTVLVTVVSFVVSMTQLKTSRPPVLSTYSRPDSAEDIQAVYARLWDDPLAIYYAHDSSQTAPGADLTEVADYRFDSIVRVQATKSTRPVLLMPVLLPGGPYGEDAEERIRTRYAIQAGLANEGFELALGDRMSYMKMTVYASYSLLDANPHPVELLIPVKLHLPTPELPQPDEQGETRYSAVQIVYLDESKLGDRPLDVIRQIFENMYSPGMRERVHVAVMGPSSSGTLEAMFAEDAIWSKSRHPRRQLARDRNRELRRWLWAVPDVLRPLYDGWLQEQEATAIDNSFPGFPANSFLYSPRATVPQKSFRDLPEPSLQPSTNTWNCGLQLIRCIGTDDMLVQAMIVELGRRGVEVVERAKDDHVLIVTERDSRYGNSIRKLFLDHGVPTDRLHSFQYLRGVDGASSQNKSDSANGGADSSTRVRGAIEPTTGTAQLDYLRRMSREVSELDARLRREGKGRIRAIGVVGQDLYDKLLVLRALRRTMPSAWFFTTDLDAGYAHPDELPTSRNLLVASHFALKLNERLTPRPVPFRDSYQTATCFATIQALSRRVALEQFEQPLNVWGIGDDEPNMPRLQPLIFEIGNRGPYQLTQLSPELGDSLELNARVHPQGPRTTGWGEFRPFDVLLLLASGLFLAVCAAFFEPRTRWALSFLATPAVVAAGLLAWAAVRIHTSLFPSRRRGHATRRKAGDDRSATRHSPAARVLAFTAVRRPRVVLALLALLAQGAAASLAFLIWTSHVDPDGEPFSMADGISVWPSILLRVVVFGAALTFLIQHPCRLWRRREHEAASEPRRESDVERGWARLKHAWRSRDRDGLNGWQILLPFGLLESLASDQDPEKVTKRHEALAAPRFQLARTMLLTTLYMLFGICLFLVFGFPNLPSRGDYYRMTSYVITQAAVVTLIASIMYVLDSTNLAVFLVRGLGRGLTEHPRNAAAADPPPPENFQANPEWRVVRQVADHTKVVGRAFWWPCALILIMAVSRLRFFDCWDFSWSLISLLLVNISAAVASAIILRRESAKVRSAIVAGLRRRQQLHEVRDQEQAARSLKILIENVEAVHDGALGPWKRDPVLWALSLPFASAAGLTLVQQLLAAS